MPGTPSRKQHRGRTPDGQGNPIDRHVGQRVRLCRTLLGVSQEHLATAIGLTSQQVQKYERGWNRISASRLFTIARVLGVPVSYFFDGMPDEVAASSPALMQRGEPPEIRPDPAARRESLELVRAYYSIGNAETRQKIHDLIKAAADDAGGAEE